MNSSSSTNPFVAAGMIQDSKLFVGRQGEINAIVSRMEGAQPTSINVVGEKRIGKSSLLYHFFRTWEQRVRDASLYVVVYLSLQSVHCQRENDFYEAVAKELLSRSTVKTKQTVCDLLQRRPIERRVFSEAIKECKHQGILPVLCLDDFKELFERKSEFNDDFYDNLRSLMDNSSLMLVIATTNGLDFYAKKHQLTSSFFNLGHLLRLGELTEDEARDLVRLPASTVSGADVALGMDEQKLTRELGGNHPFLLQLAGSLVWEARQQGKDKNWMKTRFAEESKRVPGNQRRWLRRGRFIRDMVSGIGAFSQWLAQAWNDAKDLILGIVILVIIILAIFGVLNPEKVKEFLGYLLNLTK
ncbi:MAG: ATP-binding protein [Scytonema sp. PMC 1069.18]|nr:ATP-binding protein [Scytonema sp. PMC 1069.18]MEC4887642.1 ATP-binding protein [Scytonema sp. PMC 1070.18]